MVRCKEFYERWLSVGGENWCEKAPDTVKDINHYLGIVEKLEEMGVKKETTFVALSETAARPLTYDTKSKAKQKAISEVASRLKREQDRLERGFKPTPVQHQQVKKIVWDAQAEVQAEDGQKEQAEWPEGLWEGYKEETEKHEQQLQTPEGQEFIKKRENANRHLYLQNAIEESAEGILICCPECGAGSENLKWSCCDLPVAEAIKIAYEQHQEVVTKRSGKRAT
jgi:hypothetical protein